MENVVNEVLATLREHFDGITATNMNDLMRLTNNKIPDEQRVEHEIQVKIDSDPVKQKTRGIPYSFREDFKKTILKSE